MTKIQSVTALDEEVFDIYTEINGRKNENNVSDEMLHELKFVKLFELFLTIRKF